MAAKNILIVVDNNATSASNKNNATVILSSSGPQGPMGPTGSGTGVPAGGLKDQVLTKKTDSDYDIGWTDQTGGSGGGHRVRSNGVDLPDRIGLNFKDGIEASDNEVDGSTDISVSKASIGLDQVDNTSDKDKPLSDATIEALAGKQNSLMFSPEDVTNKDTDGTLSANLDGRYPSQRAVKTYVDNTFAGLTKDDVGLGDVDNTADEDKPLSEASRIALADKQDLLLFSPEDVSNKDDDGSLSNNSDVKYPTQRAVKSYVDGEIAGLTKVNVGLDQVDNVSDEDKPLSAAARAALAGKQDVLNYIPEDSSNKDADESLSGDSDVKYPTQKAVKSYVDSKVAGVSKESIGLGNVTNDVQLKFEDLDVDGSLSSNSDSKVPSQRAVKTYVDSKDLGFIPEDVSNKSADVNLGSSDSLYPTQRAVKVYVDAHTGGSGTPGGNDTNIQFNSNGGFAGSEDLTWDGSILNVNGDVAANNLSGVNTGDQIDIPGNAETVTTNADLTGPIGSNGNATFVNSQTGSGNKFVMDDGPTLISPNIGEATATSINGTSIPSDKTLVVTTDKLNVHAQTSSSELESVISDGTGSGPLVFADSPNITSPTGLVKEDVGLGNVTNDAQLKVADLDVDGTLSENSDSKVPSQKATKTYVDLRMLKSANLSDVGNAETAFVNIKQDASASSTGVVQLTNDFGGSAESPTVVSTHLSSPLPVAQGGTGQSSASNAFNALSPITTLGDIIFGSGQNVSSRLPGNTSTSKRFLVQTGTGSDSAAPSWGSIAASDVPTLNQSTTGSAATLTTARSIYGNSFDGSASLNQVIASTYGGTGNGFTKFVGPDTAEKTFTLPNASATILTTNAVVTIDQGGTGQTSAANAINALVPSQSGNTGKFLTTNGSEVSWAAVSGGGGGSQTPWQSDIDGGGFALSNVKSIKVGGGSTALAFGIAGNYLKSDGGNSQLARFFSTVIVDELDAGTITGFEGSVAVTSGKNITTVQGMNFVASAKASEDGTPFVTNIKGLVAIGEVGLGVGGVLVKGAEILARTTTLSNAPVAVGADIDVVQGAIGRIDFAVGLRVGVLSGIGATDVAWAMNIGNYPSSFRGKIIMGAPNFLTLPTYGLHMVGTAADSSVIALKPSVAVPTSPPINSEVLMYVSGTKIVFATNNAGTMRYKSLDMSGTGVTWAHSTTAP